MPAPVAVSLAMLAAAAFDPGVLPISVADSWPSPTQDGIHFGDIRAVLDVPAGTPVNASVQAQIFWRRRDRNPGVKMVLVTDSAGRGVAMPLAVLQFPPPGVERDGKRFL